MSQSMHTLYAYVEGGDLAAVQAQVEAHCNQLVSSGGWRLAPPIVVNQPHPRTPDMKADDLPGWDLGLNVVLPDPGKEPLDWFADVERIVAFTAMLYAEIQRPIIFGVWDASRRVSEDLFDVYTTTPDVEELRRVLGYSDAR